MQISDLIDIALWDRAQWKGVLFVTMPDAPPVLALVFTNQEAGESIFRSWHELLGDEDRDEAIRVSIIDGDIPGKGPGYTVHIGPAATRVIAENPFEQVVLYPTRLQRMQTPDSPHLARFKKAFAREGRYWLSAAILEPSGQPLLLQQFRILKTHVIFRTPDEIGRDNDSDQVVLGRPDDPRSGSQPIH